MKLTAISPDYLHGGCCGGGGFEPVLKLMALDFALHSINVPAAFSKFEGMKSYMMGYIAQSVVPIKPQAYIYHA